MASSLWAWKFETMALVIGVALIMVALELHGMGYRLLV